MTAERKSDNLNEALRFISGSFIGTAIGLGIAEVIKDPSIITNLSKKVFPKSAQKRKAA